MWIVYLIADKTPLAWAAFIVLLPVALIGFTMFARWIGVYRGGGPAAAPAGNTAAGTTTATAALEVIRAERHLPVPVVVAYDLLTAIGIGEADRRRPRTPRVLARRSPWDVASRTRRGERGSRALRDEGS